MNECIGEIVAPVSRRRIALMYVTNAAGAVSFAKLTPWYDTFGSTNHGNLSAAATQSQQQTSSHG